VRKVLREDVQSGMAFAQTKDTGVSRGARGLENLLSKIKRPLKMVLPSPKDRKGRS